MPTLLIRLRLSASINSDALPKGKYCIKITTGTSSSNDRTLAAKITFASGSDSIVVADGADTQKGRLYWSSATVKPWLTYESNYQCVD